MERFKAIISDIDGTLTPIIPDAMPSSRVRDAIRQSVDKGYIFCLASGRPFFLVQYLANHLGLLDPCIVDNGAVIANSKDGSVIWEAILPTSHAQRILKILKNCQLVRVSCDTGGFDNPQTISANSKVRKLSVHDIPIDLAETLISTVTTEFKDVAAIKAASYANEQLIDVYFSNANATKQHAVVKLAELLDISPREIIGIGDGYNDFPLLMACGFKVAMGNAVPELKAIADDIAPPVEEDGLAHILEKYLL